MTGKRRMVSWLVAIWLLAATAVIWMYFKAPRGLNYDYVPVAAILCTLAVLYAHPKEF